MKTQYTKLSEASLLRSRFFTDQEQEKLPYVEPIFFVDAYFRKSKTFGFSEAQLREYCVQQLQKVFHVILRKFFKTAHGSFFSAVKKDLAAWHHLVYVIDHNALPEPSVPESPRSSEEALVASLHRKLTELISETTPRPSEEKITITQRFDLNQLKDRGWQYKTLAWLQRSVERDLASAVKTFLVHGSFGSQDFLPQWSDLDTQVIIKDSLFADEAGLRSARERFLRLTLINYKIDPLAHHEFDFVTETDLRYYPSYFFPPRLYPYGMLLAGDRSLSFRVRSDGFEKTQQLAAFVYHFRQKLVAGRYSRIQHAWKDDLAHIMMLPTLLLQARNIYVYKKFSFERVREAFPKIDMSPIMKATEIMRRWRRHNLLRWYPNSFLKALPYPISRVLFGLHRRASAGARPDQSAEEIKNLTNQFLIIAEDGFHEILTSIK